MVTSMQVSVDGEMVKVTELFTDELSLPDLKVWEVVLKAWDNADLCKLGSSSHCRAHNRPAQRSNLRARTFLRKKTCPVS